LLIYPTAQLYFALHPVAFTSQRMRRLRSGLDRQFHNHMAIESLKSSRSGDGYHLTRASDPPIFEQWA
jgi:hypothetical protein